MVEKGGNVSGHRRRSQVPRVGGSPWPPGNNQIKDVPKNQQGGGMGTYQKDTGTNLKELPIANAGRI